MKKIVFLLTLLLSTWMDAKQKKQVNDLSIIKIKDWILAKNDTLDYAMGTFQGKKALLLRRKIMNYKSASLAYPSNFKFTNGIIELDIAYPGKDDGFIGVAFRIRDAHHYETVYFRPASSGTINAIQYMPEKKTEFNWWDYEATKYQANAILPHNNWFHVKVVVNGKKMEVYLNYALKPSMLYNALDPSLKSGSVGFWLGNCSLGAYKNLIVTTL